MGAAATSRLPTPPSSSRVVGASAGAPGYIVTGFALDGGPAGSGLDVLSVTVRTGLGQVVFSAEGPVNEGGVIVRR